MEEGEHQYNDSNNKDLMGGDEDTAITGVDDELSLPKATVYKLITEMLPTGVACPKETRDLLIGCCVEFIHLLSSEANEVCERSGRKTIAPEHVGDALKNLGFGAYVDEVMATYEEAQTAVKEKEKQRGSSKLEKSGLTEEELLKQQEELFQQARLKYLQNQANAAAGGSSVIAASSSSNNNNNNNNEDTKDEDDSDDGDGDDSNNNDNGNGHKSKTEE